MVGKSSHWIDNFPGIVPIAKSLSREKINSKEYILKLIFNIFQPVKVVELGCGKAGWLAAAKSLGATEIKGYDLLEIDISERNIKPEEFQPADLSREIEFLNRYDLAISTEVAEHIPSSSAKQFIRNLTVAAPVIIFSAAPPYQEGLGHVNENWVEYWHSFFLEFGFYCFDFIRDSLWHMSEIPYYYRQNILIYCEKSMIDIFSKSGFSPTNIPKSLIHPEMLIKAVHRKKSVSGKFDMKKDVLQYYSNCACYNHLEKINCDYGDNCFENRDSFYKNKFIRLMHTLLHSGRTL